MSEIMPSLLIEARHINKAFHGIRALHEVCFDLEPGEVHALVGENGAGKSTLIKIITGAIPADSGTLTLAGRDMVDSDPAIAHARGIAAIYQEPMLFPDLTVAENITWSRGPGCWWRRVNRKASRRQAQELLSRLGAPIDPDRLAGSLTMPEQQMVEIAKAIGAGARALIMDEPTASLTDLEVDRLFEVIRGLRAQGAGIIYISHRLDEIFAIADRITVLRDGEGIATRPASELDRARLIELMVGRSVATIYPRREIANGETVLELRNVSCEKAGLRNVSLFVRSGEILGLAGLVGSGRTELAEVIFGLRPADSGEILVRGGPVRISSPKQAIAAGLGFVPEDRRRHGVVLEMPITANTSLASLKTVSRCGWIDTQAERSLAERYVRELRIKTASAGAITATLSGGNQQKVALARWLATAPKVLILDEPTQGVDVGAKAEIHQLIAELARRGMAILMISSELPEILGMSDRIAVMHAGSISEVLSRSEATQQKILAMALGHTPTGEMARVEQ
jgi:ABC-type sugar transport system ATPase subunit